MDPLTADSESEHYKKKKKTPVCMLFVRLFVVFLGHFFLLEICGLDFLLLYHTPLCTVSHLGPLMLKVRTTPRASSLVGLSCSKMEG